MSRLDEAMADVRRRLPDLQEVLRVDVDDFGAVHVTARTPQATHWFVHDDRGLIARRPQDDPALPLAERLQTTDDWTVLSYRAGRRAVVQVTQGGCRNVVKGHRKGRSARAAVNQSIAEGTLRSVGVRVPRLLRHEGRHEALVFEHADVQEIELDASATPYLARLGAHLRGFQEDPCRKHVKSFLHTDELGVLDLWRRKVERAVGELPDGWEAGRQRVEELAGALGEIRPVLAHRDLHDRQLFRIDGEVALLDFDLLCQADSALDAANLIAHLRWRAMQGLFGADEATAEAGSRALLEGLDRNAEPDFDRRLAFYQATAFLRLALVYRVRPPWGTLVPGLVERAAAALEDPVSLP
jgi:hypothetical protein